MIWQKNSSTPDRELFTKSNREDGILIYEDGGDLTTIKIHSKKGGADN